MRPRHAVELRSQARDLLRQRSTMPMVGRSPRSRAGTVSCPRTASPAQRHDALVSNLGAGRAEADQFPAILRRSGVSYGAGMEPSL